MAKSLKKFPAGKVGIFKIKNRRGYAAVCMKNLTEGTTANQAFERMAKAVKRNGFELSGQAPRAK
ncbi:MAG: hypothetical protein EXS63_07320 [Candidatus Omnitrophica bacterium]|nr:hypothetical protein [Candidatus Omnitrophota bacterium]